MLILLDAGQMRCRHIRDNEGEACLASKSLQLARLSARTDGDLPLISHPVATGVRWVFAPIGTVCAVARHSQSEKDTIKP